MNRECICFLTSKVNGKCPQQGKSWSKCIIYVVKYSVCDATYIDKLQQTFKNEQTVISPISSVLSRNGQKLDSFAAHFEQHFHASLQPADLRKFRTFKVVKQLNLIRAMKTFTKPNCNICMEERLTFLKKIRDKHVTIMNKNSEIYGACRHKTTFHRFSLSTDYPVFNW